MTSTTNNNKAKRQSNPIVSSGFIIFVIAALLIDGAVLFFTSQNDGIGDYTEEIDEYISDADIQDDVEEEVPTATDVIEENTYDETSYTITSNGVASIFLGGSMKDYNISNKSENEMEGLCYDNSFVEVQKRTVEGYDYSVLYMNLYKDNEKIFSLYGGTSEEKPNVLDATVHSIFVYSPQFKLSNGIHTGMTAEELINNYGATLQLHEGEGGEDIQFITFEIPDITGFMFIVDKEELLRVKGEYFLQGYNPQTGSYNENYRKDIEEGTRQYGKLGIIVIGTEFDIF